MSETITLPEKDEIERKLDEMEMRSSVKQDLYPFILRFAGEKMSGRELALLLLLAAERYLKDMPIDVLCNKLIDALTEDEQVRQEAKDLAQEIASKS